MYLQSCKAQNSFVLCIWKPIQLSTRYLTKHEQPPNSDPLKEPPINETYFIEQKEPRIIRGFLFS